MVGVEAFPSQPSLVGAISVPELLNKGGRQKVLDPWVKYGPRPFVEPAMDVTLRKMEQEIECVPL